MGIKRLLGIIAAAAIAASGCSRHDSGYSPPEETAQEYIFNKLESSSVIILGEQHNEPGSERRFMASLTPHLKEHGVEYIALEILSKYQPEVDEYLSSGKTTERWFFEQKDYASILRAAKDNGINILCMDASLLHVFMGRHRDYAMAKSIEDNILAKGEKAIVFIGAAHACENNDRLGGLLSRRLGNDSVSIILPVKARRIQNYPRLQEFHMPYAVMDFDVDGFGNIQAPSLTCGANYRMSDCFDAAIFLPKD